MSGLHQSHDVTLITENGQMLAQNSDVQALGYQESSENSDTNTPAHSVRLPLTLKAYNRWSIEGLTVFYFCGQSMDDRLYAVEIQHTKSGGKAPLSKRPGLFLHDSPAISSPIVAAAADEEISPNRYVARGPNSDIILVNTQNCNNDYNDVATDVMRPRMTDGGKVAFSFQVEVGAELEKRNDVFSWIQVAKKGEAGLDNGGFKLIRHPSKPKQLPEAVDDLFSPTRHWPAHDMCMEDEILAFLSNGKRWQLSSWKHMFTIQFTDEDVLRRMEDSLARMILVTAARLRYLSATGRTSESGLVAASRKRTSQLYSGT
ncbi:hypothetical protein F4803DRAFT_572315 [Xylaria telfairii]|nr:hypothetical protein F4803DRAFT_572315 [Xylaria telfairii]